MLALDSALDFDPAREEEFFAAIPPRPGVLLVEPRAACDAPAEPFLVRTADLRRAAERLLRAPIEPTKRLNLREAAAGIRFRVVGSKFEQWLVLYQQARERFPRRYRDLLRLRPPALLKINLRNSYPRCYVTRRIAADGGYYLGPFPSRRAAEAFAEELLDLFKMRRCQIKIRRDPSFPGCIYSEMKMCLAPCFAGCTKEEYDAEVLRIIETLDSSGAALTRGLERAREAASEALDFERARMLHKKIEKVKIVLRDLPELARSVDKLDAVILQRAAEQNAVAVFQVSGGIIADPFLLQFDEAARQPRSIEEVLRERLTAPQRVRAGENAALAGGEDYRERYGLQGASERLAEHLCLLARWYYLRSRAGEIFLSAEDWPYRRMIRACARLLGTQGSSGNQDNG